MLFLLNPFIDSKFTAFFIIKVALVSFIAFISSDKCSDDILDDIFLIKAKHIIRVKANIVLLALDSLSSICLSSLFYQVFLFL